MQHVWQRRKIAWRMAHRRTSAIGLRASVRLRDRDGLGKKVPYWHARQARPTWLADTARKEFTIRAGLAAVSQFEQDHGAFTPEELAEAEQWAATAVERASRTGSSVQCRTA
jgi:hypothetical protein